jgi:hypothetical protein
MNIHLDRIAYLCIGRVSAHESGSVSMNALMIVYTWDKWISHSGGLFPLCEYDI